MIRHRNALTKKAREDTIQGLGRLLRKHHSYVTNRPVVLVDHVIKFQSTQTQVTFEKIVSTS